MISCTRDSSPMQLTEHKENYQKIDMRTHEEHPQIVNTRTDVGDADKTN